jgi:hypothetical protein
MQLRPTFQRPHTQASTPLKPQQRSGTLFEISPGTLLREAFKAVSQPAPNQQVIQQRLQKASLTEVERQTLTSLGTPQGTNTWITRLQRQGDEAMRRSAGALLPAEERDEFFRISQEVTQLFQNGRAVQNTPQGVTTRPEFQVGVKQLIGNTLSVINKARQSKATATTEGSFLVRLATEADKAARQGAAAQLPPDEAERFLRLANTATQVFTLGRRKSILAAQIDAGKSQLNALTTKSTLSAKEELQVEQLKLRIRSDEAVMAGLPTLRRRHQNTKSNPL